MENQRKVGMFGGSFNPIHKMHVRVAQIAMDALSLDKLYFIPTYQSPFKENGDEALVSHRITMIKNVLLPNTDICPFEVNRKGISYTFETVRYFRSKSSAQLFLIIGSDNINQIHRWRNIDEIAKTVQIVAVRRKMRIPISKENVKKYGIRLLDVPSMHGSSTNFRKGNFANIDEKNWEYIGDHMLYLEDILKNTLSDVRFRHCLATGQLAREYARNLGYDSQIAYIAGLVHDITKEWTDDRHQRFLKKHGVDCTDIPLKVLHQHSGALWLEKVYKLSNKEIIQAVRNHTTAALEMSTLDKIVYLADKLCQGRRFLEIQKERQLAFTNFELAFRRAISRMRDVLVAKNAKISKNFGEIIDKWAA